MTVIEKEQVINAAQEAAENAYVPYSQFRVELHCLQRMDAFFKDVTLRMPHSA